MPDAHRGLLMDTILGMIWLFAMLHIPYALLSDRALQRSMYRKWGNP